MRTTSTLAQKQDAASTSPPICICCGERFDGGASSCGACFAPRELSDNQALSQAKFISVLGASGSGKTVYLSILIDMLSNGESTLKAAPKTSFSMAAQTRTLAALQDRCFPDKTPTDSDRWNWVQCDLTNEKHPRQLVHLITPDLPGEAIAYEFERPGSLPPVRELIRQSQAVIMLVDALAVCQNNTSQDHFALQTASYLYEIKQRESGNRSREFNIPIAVVFTKCDECQDVLDSPGGFARNNVSRLVAYCESTFPNHRFFAAGVAGSLATIVDSHGRQMRVPLHTEPRGVVEPIEWIMNQKEMR